MVAVLRRMGAIGVGSLAGVVFLRSPSDLAILILASILTVLALALCRPDGFRLANVALSGLAFFAVVALTLATHRVPSLDDEITSLPAETTVEGVIELLGDHRIYLWADSPDRERRVPLGAETLRARDLVHAVEQATGKHVRESEGMRCGNGQPFFPNPTLRLTLFSRP